MNTVYSIGALAREFEVTPRTIRFYEDRGLLAPQRTGQARVYSARDRTRLKLILRGKRLGFSLREIGDILDLYDAPDGEASQLRHFIHKIRERREALLRQRDDLMAVLHELDAIEAQCTRLVGQSGAHKIQRNPSA
jgi:DNA-binding transcriptional MerR regulator